MRGDFAWASSEMLQSLNVRQHRHTVRKESPIDHSATENHVRRNGGWEVQQLELERKITKPGQRAKTMRTVMTNEAAILLKGQERKVHRDQEQH